MSEEILINITPRETRVAVIEQGALQEIHIERATYQRLVGNIYRGRVVRVLPGMQAAFVEIGLNKAAFLHLSDMLWSASEATAPLQPMPEIHQLITEGQDITVQVIKDPIGTKGARLTTHLSLSSRYLVFMPHLTHIGISQRIEAPAERERLQHIIEGGKSEQGGYIVRTAAEGASAIELSAHQLYLQRYWHSLKQTIHHAAPGTRVHQDLPLLLRALRDLVSVQTKKIRIDNQPDYTQALIFAQDFIPNIVHRLVYYTQQRPLFDLYQVEDEIQKALHRKVFLKSGGYLIFDQTEAMTTIDVNTGAFVGQRNLEQTIVKNNLEAAVAIARQLRLRNLGGILIIDFIDMQDEAHKQQVLNALEQALAGDNTKNKISQVSSLGLVEMTRKRTRESLEQILCQPCPTCQGRGSIKSVETICNEIFRALLRFARAYRGAHFLVLAAQEVVDRMHHEESMNVATLEQSLQRSIKFQIEILYTQEQFDVVLI